MSKAGPLTRSRSKRLGHTAPGPSVRGRTSPSKGPSLNVEVPPRVDLGRRLHSDEIVIGLALGSPGQSPLPPLPPDDRDVDVCNDVDVSYSASSPRKAEGGLGTVTEIGTGGQDIKRKGSKWKSFGSLFGRKDSVARVSEASPFYQLDRIPGQGSAKSRDAENHLEINALRRKRADSSRSKTGTDSSQSTTKGEGNGLLRRNSSRRRGLRRRKAEEMKPDMFRLPNSLSAHAEVEDLQPPSVAPRRPMASLLQVEIPNVELDRYSVMFGDLLGSNPHTRPKPKKQQSLLSRTQVNVEDVPAGANSEDCHLSSMDNLPKPPHRRDDSTSSKSSKTPSFSLFPSSSSTPRQSANSMVSKSLPKPSPLGRSTTAPNTLAPPNRPQIHKSKSEDREQVLFVVHSPAEVPSTLDPPSRRHSLDAPSFSDSKLETGSLNLTSQVSQGIFSDYAFPARKSSMKRLPQPPKDSVFSSHPRDDSVGTAAEVSIARQISISRRQRQLLVPVAPKLARQPRQPTLVDGISTPAARKSHHLTLEDA